MNRCAQQPLGPMTFDDALRDAIALVTAETADARIAPSSRTLLLAHASRAPRAVLLYHGLTSAPPQFSALARRLHERGANVLVPRLPFHGYRNQLTDALRRIDAEELLAWAVQCVILASGLGERLDVGGTSLGGLLAAWVGQHLAVATAFAIAPLFGIRGIPPSAACAAAAALLRLPNVDLWWDPLWRAESPHVPPHAYYRFSTRALAASIAIGEALRRAARQRAPAARRLVLFLNPRDRLVANAVAAEIAREWRAHGAAVDVVRLDGARARHDVVEPWHGGREQPRVYRTILEALDCPSN